MSAQEEFGSTPLHEASSARFLVEHAADVSYPDKDSQTVLDLAIFSGHIDLTGFLVEQHIDTTSQATR